MRRWMMAGIVGTLLLVGVTGAWAATATPDFERMLPHMKDMHPEMGDAELKAMFEACHAGGGHGMMMGMMHRGWK